MGSIRRSEKWLILIVFVSIFYSDVSEAMIEINWRMLNHESMTKARPYPTLTDDQKKILQYYLELKDSNPESEAISEFEKRLSSEGEDLNRFLKIRDYNLKLQNILTTEFDGKYVKVPGFLVPVEFNVEMKATRLLLVPIAGACVHVPAPPANQIIDIYYPQGYSFQSLEKPVWVEGYFGSGLINEEFYLIDGKSDISVGYKISGVSIVDY